MRANHFSVGLQPARRKFTKEQSERGSQWIDQHAETANPQTSASGRRGAVAGSRERRGGDGNENRSDDENVGSRRSPRAAATTSRQRRRRRGGRGGDRDLNEFEPAEELFQRRNTQRRGHQQHKQQQQQQQQRVVGRDAARSVFAVPEVVAVSAVANVARLASSSDGGRR